jgi:hypothetical protein
LIASVPMEDSGQGLPPAPRRSPRRGDPSEPAALLPSPSAPSRARTSKNKKK